MRSVHVTTGGAALALALIMAAPLPAQTVDEEPVGRLTIGGQIGYLASGMGEVNDNLSVVNRFLNRGQIRSMDKVSGSLITGLDVRYKLSDVLSLGVNWGALNAKSTFDVNWVNVRFFTRATTYQASAYYHFPFAANLDEKLQLFAGGGFLLLESGRVEWSLLDKPADRNSFLVEGDISELSGQGKASGSGKGFTLAAGGSYQLNSTFSVAAEFGYRVGKMTDLTIDPNDVEGYYERFGVDENNENPTVREPGDWAIWDFFLRDPNATLPDGRKRTDPLDPDVVKTGCAGCPIYYEGGNLEVDFSGVYSSLALRVHF